eukprot:8306059-Pyramimonas_sp.AAC.1
MEAQAQTLISVLTHASGMTMDVATVVSQEINGGPWSPAQKTMLCSVLGDRMANADSSKSGGQKNARAQQTCKALHMYLTNLDWSLLEDDRRSPLSKLEVIGTRMYKIGLTCPGASVLKRAVGIIMIVGLPSGQDEISAQTQRQWMTDLQSLIKAMDEKATHPAQHVKHLPDDPRALAPPVFHFAYGDDVPGEPPIEVTTQLLDMMEDSLGYRKTHKSFRA